jgi:hypothetical protein
MDSKNQGFQPLRYSKWWVTLIKRRVLANCISKEAVVPNRIPPSDAIIQRMTLMTMTFELQDQLKPAQFRALGEFANTYGLHNFHYDEKKNRLQVDYDASRLRESVVEHVLRQARIPVLRKLEPGNQ